MLTTATYITLADQVHEGLYTYSSTHFINNESSVIVTCPIHGDFAINAKDHLKGLGCLDCFVASFNKRSDPTTKHNTKELTVINKPRPDGYVYLMQTRKGLLKIGVSQEPDAKRRLKGIKASIKENCPKDKNLTGLKVLKVFRSKSGSVSDAYKAETKAHRKFSHLRSKLQKFDGYTEFFHVSAGKASQYLQSIGLEPVETTV
ncbi:TPA: GIY-YIG nuclease family protein [Enterobacter hormaechei subsp. xiangfangensis]|nr:GIY-YIG nuclease family protein [Enterobacter hormaechei subsp. xiangfangensis]HAV1860661.1 GIY-YIG nuclease family protein [Enterobacter hormaechei subsp. xiangfangensis]